jgi:hypothetical protein
VYSCEGNIDHPFYFSSHKLSDENNNYTTNKHEGLAMEYALQKFRHYLLGTPFKFFTNHYVLKYLVKCWGCFCKCVDLHRIDLAKQ